MNIFLIAAITADGFIAENVKQISTSWTSKEDKKFFSARTKEAGVVVMGSKTYATVKRPLPDRLNIVYSKSHQAPQENLRYTNESPAQLLSNLEKEGFSEVAICGGASIYTMFLKAGLINKLYITIEPVLFGSGIKLLGEEMRTRLQLVAMKKLAESTILLEYDVLPGS